MEDHSRNDCPAKIPHALLTCPDKTVLTPHLGSAVGAVRREIEQAAANNIIDVLRGIRPRDAINEPLWPKAFS
jgi:phosphonate dehydrogenase